MDTKEFDKCDQCGTTFMWTEGYIIMKNSKRIGRVCNDQCSEQFVKSKEDK